MNRLKMPRLGHSLKHKLACAAGAVLAAAPAIMGQAATPSDLIDDAKADALLIVGAGGLALGLIALARVGWTVATKWVKRSTGAA